MSPLAKGRGRKTVSRNIRKLVHEGYPQPQAIAISMEHAGLSYKKRKNKRRAR